MARWAGWGCGQLWGQMETTGSDETILTDTVCCAPAKQQVVCRASRTPSVLKPAPREAG